jgi:hypothetical protein
MLYLCFSAAIFWDHSTFRKPSLTPAFSTLNLETWKYI